MTETESFVRGLAVTSPSLAALLEQHLSEYGELLPHVYFGDLSRFAVEQLAHIESGETNARLTLEHLLLHLERGLEQGGDDIRDLISVSFLENVASELAASAKLRSLLSPRLSSELGSILRSFGYDGHPN